MIAYQQSADVYFPYGYYYPKPVANELQINTNRPKLVSWIVSHCRTHSKREHYVKTLQQYIPVDIYGRCGPLNCSRTNRSCLHMIELTYKFYLSFENSACVDYITEKAWKILAINVVPVVMGGADYKSLLPPHSFIDVRDFRSAKHLAEYLLMLSNNDTLYRKYFEWKQHYDTGRPSFYCQLCAYMNRVHAQNDTSTWAPGRLTYVSDIERQCIKPENYFTREDFKTFA